MRELLVTDHDGVNL